MEANKQKFDVIISGGGLSGTLMALSLSKLTKADGSLLSIAIVEAQSFQQTSPVDKSTLFDGRVLALSHGSARYLAELAVWPHLKEQACAITDIDISDRGHFAKARLSATEYNVNALGYVIDMALIGKAQLKVLAEKSGANKNIHWFSPDSITEVNWHQDTMIDLRHDVENKSNESSQSDQSSPKGKANTDLVTVTLNSGVKISAKLLLGCDGINSPVRQFANIDITSSDYNQTALIANVSTSKPHHHKAFERFTEFGPIAMLPLTQVNMGSINTSSGQGANESRCSLVWTMTPRQADKINNLDDDAFKAELEKAFGSYLGAITYVGKRDTYPLKLLKAQQQTYHRMGLVGNASHTIHPVAGQGFNLGLRDVKVLSELVCHALAENKDIGSYSLLHAYQQNRLQDQQQIIELTDSLISLFANDLPPLVVGRNIGLQALNIVSPLKNALVKKTMGY